jgi:methyl-accepting chemotaxis protein
MPGKTRSLIAKITPLIIGSISLSFVICLGFVLIQTRSLALGQIKEQALMLIRVFEPRISTFYDKEDAEGWNEGLNQAVAELMRSSSEILEINVYKIANGKVAASSDEAMRGKEVDPEDVEAAEKDTTVVLFEKEEGENFIDITAPIHHESKIDYVMGIKINIEDDIARINTTIFHASLIGLLFILIITVATLFIAKSVVLPIQTAAEGFRDLAEGDADLTKRLMVNRNDEIGRLAEDFNVFASRLQNAIAGIKESQAEIGALATELERTSGETAKAVTHITESIGNVRGRASDQAESARNSAATVEEIARNIEALDRSIGEQAACVSQASASIEEMVANINSVSASMEKLATQFEEVSLAANEGKEAQQATGELVRRIYERSRSLQDANATIAAIAAQTNLLAMNAAIEAAHAGDAGRGFSVVADEIRKLAENSANQSKAIRTDIKTVDQAIEEVVISSERLSKTIDKIEERISHTSEIVHQVGGTMAEQKEGSNQLLSALGSLKSITIQVRSGSSEMNSGNASLVTDMAKLRSVAVEIEQDMERVGQVARELDATAQGSAKMAGTAGHAIRTMESSVGRFKV